MASLILIVFYCPRIETVASVNCIDWSFAKLGWTFPGHVVYPPIDYLQVNFRVSHSSRIGFIVTFDFFMRSIRRLWTLFNTEERCLTLEATECWSVLFSYGLYGLVIKENRVVIECRSVPIIGLRVEWVVELVLEPIGRWMLMVEFGAVLSVSFNWINHRHSSAHE